MNHQGRPTKRTKQVVSELLDAIASGAPYGLACQAAGIHHDTFNDWRRRDPAFALKVDQAAARGTIKRLKKIEAQGDDGNWSALAWMIERRYPHDFSKPEVQLNIGIQNNLNGASNTGQGFETLVLSDLEFAALRTHEGYAHHKPEKPARDVEVEAEVVPEDLSGHLSRQDQPRGAIISQSQSEENRRRVDRANAAFDAAFKAKRGGGAGNGKNAGYGGNGQSSDPPASGPQS